MIVVERLTPEWRDAFLASHNSLFTNISAAHIEHFQNRNSVFPVRTFIAREDGEVLAWGRFYLRKFSVYGDSRSTLKVAMACGIGTLPEYQRQGLGRKVWRFAEDALAAEVEAVLLYTSEGGKGFPFYRAQGYVPLFYPRPMRLSVAKEDLAEPSNIVTKPFVESRTMAGRRGEVFVACYRGYGGFMADRPSSLDQWADISFMYDPQLMGCTPQISWLENADGQWTAYVIWSGPIRKMGWKKTSWKFGNSPVVRTAIYSCLAVFSFRRRKAALEGNGQIDWWAPSGHFLVKEMLALGFEERPRSLSVLGKVFDPAALLGRQIQKMGPISAPIECRDNNHRRLEIRFEGSEIEIEMQAATRMLLGRSSGSLEHMHGLLTLRPSQKEATMIETLDRVFPMTKWSYFESEFI